MSNIDRLTERQRDIYDFIKEKIESRGYGPTVREIGDAFGISSPNGVMCHLNALVSKGLITRVGGKARAIQLVDYQRPGSASVPMLGNVAAGPLTEAVPQMERLEFKDLFCRPDHFALQVHGQSMIEDHIEDGDYVIIRKQSTAENGERVVAMVDDEVTLKRFYRRKDHIVLQPANESMEPIIVDATEDTKVLGVLVGVVRHC